MAHFTTPLPRINRGIRSPLPRTTDGDPERQSSRQSGTGNNEYQILREGELFLRPRTSLPEPTPRLPIRTAASRRTNPSETAPGHAAALSLSRHARSGKDLLGHWIMDWLRIFVFFLVVLFCLSIPGLAFGPITPRPRFYGLLAAAIVFVGIWLWRIKEPLTGKGAPAPSGGLTLSTEEQLHIGGPPGRL